MPRWRSSCWTASDARERGRPRSAAAWAKLRRSTTRLKACIASIRSTDYSRLSASDHSSTPLSEASRSPYLQAREEGGFHADTQRCAIVTGSSKGIGAAVAQRLAQDGFRVVVNHATGAQAGDALVAKIERGITVNVVAPGPVATELFLGGKSEEQVAAVTRMIPLGRLGEPEDIARVVAFLAGPDGGWINGQVLRANGGVI